MDSLKNAYELLNLREIKILPIHKTNILFQMGKDIFEISTQAYSSIYWTMVFYMYLDMRDCKRFF